MSKSILMAFVFSVLAWAAPETLNYYRELDREKNWTVQRLDSAFDDLQKMVDQQIDHGDKGQNMADIVELSVMLAKRDNSDYLGEILFPLYKKQPSQLMEAVDRLPKKKDARLLKEIISIAVRTLDDKTGTIEK